MKASAVLEQLRLQKGVRLETLPATSGVYALRNHTGEICYVGIAHSEGFRTRIYSKHTTGSEDRSHKFSCAYNVGRMWRDRHVERFADAKIAKDLRTAFIRKHCTASFVQIENYGTKAQLEEIERQVINLATADETLWNRPFRTAEEPKELVDQLIVEGRYSATDLAALQRQQIRSRENI